MLSPQCNAVIKDAGNTQEHIVHELNRVQRDVCLCGSWKIYAGALHKIFKASATSDVVAAAARLCSDNTKYRYNTMLVQYTEYDLRAPSSGSAVCDGIRFSLSTEKVEIKIIASDWCTNKNGIRHELN